MTGAHTRCATGSVRAASLASGHALLALIQNISWPASANPRRHAFAVASVRADRLTLTVHLIVAQFAHAHLRREAIGVLLTLVRADRHANAFLGTPSRLTAADVRSCAATAETTAIAMRFAQAARHVTLVAVATVQNSNPTLVMLMNTRFILFL